MVGRGITAALAEKAQHQQQANGRRTPTDGIHVFNRCRHNIRIHRHPLQHGARPNAGKARKELQTANAIHIPWRAAAPPSSRLPAPSSWATTGCRAISTPRTNINMADQIAPPVAMPARAISLSGNLPAISVSTKFMLKLATIPTTTGIASCKVRRISAGWFFLCVLICGHWLQSGVSRHCSTWRLKQHDQINRPEGYVEYESRTTTTERDQASRPGTGYGRRYRRFH